MTEQQVQTKIIKYLDSIGAYTEKVIAGTRSGLPDIRGCYKGLFFAIEVKKLSTKNNASKLQLMNIRKINDAGGKAIVAWSTEQVQDLIKELNNDAETTSI
jgi:Holliday junction resolvase